MAFIFPDPNVSTTATNPETGITYKYADGMWTPVSDTENRQDTEISSLQSNETVDRLLLTNLASRIDSNEDDIDNLEGLDINSAISLLQTARQDIIELKSKVSTLELTSFLILE
jgi:hypothetical protein